MTRTTTTSHLATARLRLWATLLVLMLTAAPAFAATIYDTGGLVTFPNAGAGGADVSLLQNNTLGMTTRGFISSRNWNRRIADDFTIPAGESWEIDSLVVYAFDTAESFIRLDLQIWDGVPDEVGSNVVFGDMITNRLENVASSGVYRVTEDDLLSTLYPIDAGTITVATTLPAGDYWIDWNGLYSGLTWGPYAPPITMLGQTTTGNGLEYVSGWQAALDGGTGTQQGFPFQINGTVIGIPEPSTVLLLTFGVLGLAFHGLRRRGSC